MDSEVGAMFYTKGVEPGLAIKDTHFNCSRKGLFAINKKFIHVTGNVWYNEEDASYQDIHLKSCINATIRDVLFVFGDNVGRTNVLINNNCDDIDIKDLRSTCSNGTLVSIDSSSSGVSIKGLRDMSAAGMVLIDNESSSTRVDHGGRILTQLRKSGNQLITDSTEETVTFETVDEDNGGWIVSGDIVIPSGLGITQISLLCNFLWSANSTGYRGIHIKLNGSQVFYGGSSNSAATTGNSSSRINTGNINVNEGDIISIKAFQNTGTGLSILANQSTYIIVKAENT
jgi:hypothetical protein